MSMTELERHLLDGLEKLKQEFETKQEKQERKMERLSEIAKKQEKQILQLSEFYNNLEPLLERLNGILRGVKKK